MSSTRSYKDPTQQRRPQYPPGSKYSLTQTSPCDPIISEILPNKLYISNIEGTADTANLQKLGITHVLSVIKTRQTEPLPPPMKRLWVPIVDTATATEGFEKAWPEPLKFLRDCMEEGGTALVHCRAGMSRSSTVVLVHLITYHRMTLRDAWTRLSSRHPIASPIIPFFRSLISLEERVFTPLMNQKQAESHSSTKTTPDPARPYASPIPDKLPTIDLLEYCMYQLHNLFPHVNEPEFFNLLKHSPPSVHSPFGRSWLNACRAYDKLHPNELQSYAKRFGGGAAPFHPFCE